MSSIVSKKAFGFYLIMIAAVAAVISLVRFSVWAPAHNAMDTTITAALVAAIVMDVIMIVKDRDILVVLSTACYAYALFRHLTNQVGSFVDAFQGINMFGDATQVGTVISIAIVMAVSAGLSVLAGFMRREKEV
ncbi:MAG: hypothetical protein Q4F83_11805 [Eubacteriales bacterium]|nr:hypothetical protein [Eubacteriales bacterium]